MANRYKIAAEFTLVDNASKKLNQMGTSGALLGNALSKSYKAAEERVNAFGRSIVSAGKMAVGIGVGALAAGIGIAAKQFIEFDQSIRAAGAAFGDLDKTAPDYEEKLTAVGKAARAVAAATEFNAVQAAEAMATFARAGIESETAIALLPGTADLATAAFATLDEGVSMAVGAMNVFGGLTDEFGKPIKDVQILSANMTAMADVMAYTADSANMSIQDVSNAIKVGGALFASGNQNINQFSAGLTSLANSGIAGAEAGTALRNIMARIAAPSKEAQKSLAALGINRIDGEGNIVSFVDLIGQFEKSMAGMGDAAKENHLKKIFGTAEIAPMLALLKTGAEGLQAYTEAAENSTGAALAKAEAIRASIGNQIEVLKSGLMEKGFQFVEKFKSLSSESITKLTEWVNNLDVESIAEKAVVAVDKIGDFISKIWEMRDVIIKVGGAILLYRGVMDGLVITNKVIDGVKTAGKLFSELSDGIETAKTAMELGSKALINFKDSSLLAKVGILLYQGAMAIASGVTTAFTAVTSALNAVFVASPIGWIVLAIVAAIALLVGIIVLCVKHWDEIVAALQRAWEWLKNVGEMIGGFFMSVWESFTNWISETLLPIWNSVVDAFKAFGEWISNVFASAWNGLGSIVTGIIDGIKSAWETLTSAFSSGGILGALKLIGGSILNFLLMPIQKLLDMISLIPGVGNLTSGLAESLQSFRDGLINVDTSDAGELSSTAPTKTSFEATNTINSREENVQTSRVTIGLEQGLKPTATYGAPPIAMERVRTGSF